MKSTILIALALISMFLVACSQQAPANRMPSANGNTVPNTTTAGNEPEPQLTQPSTPVVQTRNDITTVFDGLPSDVQDILKNGQANAKTKGFQYTLNIREGNYQSTHPAQGARVYQKGDLVKVKLPEPNQKVSAATYTNEVYLNLADKTASGYCSDLLLCKDNIGSRTASYATYVFATPSDWIAQMDNPVKMEEKTIQNRKAVRLDAKIDGQVTSIWVDRYSGLPVLVTQGSTVYSYDSFALGVKDSDVTAP